jgi:hypothetical protein
MVNGCSRLLRLLFSQHFKDNSAVHIHLLRERHRILLRLPRRHRSCKRRRPEPRVGGSL